MTHDSLFSLHEHADHVELSLHDPRQYDVLITSELGDQFKDFFDRYAPERIVVNFAGVKCVSASMIGALLTLRNRTRLYGSQLKLCGVNDNIRRVFHVLQLDRDVLEIHDEMSAAVATFADPVAREHG